MAILRKRQEEDFHGLGAEGAEARGWGEKFELTINKAATMCSACRKSTPAVECMLRPRFIIIRTDLLLVFPSLFPLRSASHLSYIHSPGPFRLVSIPYPFRVRSTSDASHPIDQWFKISSPGPLCISIKDPGKDPRQTSRSDRSVTLTCDITITVTPPRDTYE